MKRPKTTTTKPASKVPTPLTKYLLLKGLITQLFENGTVTPFQDSITRKIAEEVGYTPEFRLDMDFETSSDVVSVLNNQPDPLACYMQLVQHYDEEGNREKLADLAEVAPKINFTKLRK